MEILKLIVAGIAKKVRELLKDKPFLEDLLLSGIANLSKIAKIIQKEIREESFHAVHATLRRYTKKHEKKQEDLQKKVLEALSGSKVSVKSKLISVCLHKEPPLLEKLKRVEEKVKMERGETFNIIEAQSFTTVLLDQKNSKLLFPIKENIHKTSKNLGAVIITSPETVERTSGFVSFITNLLAKNNIDLIDFVHTSNNTTIIIPMPEVAKTFSLLSKYI